MSVCSVSNFALLTNYEGITTNAKLQVSGLKFLDWIMRLGEDKQLTIMGSVLLNGLKKILLQTNLERNIQQY